MAPRDTVRRKHARRTRASSPFGVPFSFGTPLRLNSQPEGFRSRGRSAFPVSGKQSVDDVFDENHPVGAERRTSSEVPHRDVGGYGVTPRAEYPDLQPFTTVTSAAATLGPGPGVAPAMPKTRKRTSTGANDASAVVAAARVASAEAALLSAADAAYARGKAARLAAAVANPPRVAFGGRPPPKSEHARHVAGGLRGRRAGVGTGVRGRPGVRRTRKVRDDQVASDDDSDCTSCSSSWSDGSHKENFGTGFGKGPAFSFGTRLNVASTWLAGSSGNTSPGPGAYGDLNSKLATHVPAVAFGKPPDRPGDGGASPKRPGVWDLGGGRDDSAPGPGHYHDSRVKITGPRFSFGGGKDDIGKLPEARPDDTPGPGAYYKDDVDAIKDTKGSLNKNMVGSPNKRFTFGARVGADWSSSGPGNDAPAPGSYFKNLDEVGKGVRDSAGASAQTGPSFTFGGGALRNDGKEKTAPSSPGPGDYARDDDPDATEKRSPNKPPGGYTFGWRRGSLPSKNDKATPGPGAYYQSQRGDSDPDAAAKPGQKGFTLAGKLPVVVFGETETPGPGEYDTLRPGDGTVGGGPAFTMSGDGGRCSEQKKPEESPGPATYRPRSAGKHAPAFTMYGRVPDFGGKVSASVPGPGAYNVFRPVPDISSPGSPGTTNGASSVRGGPGPTLKGREAWERAGLADAGRHSPGPAAYVTRATARPHSAAPAYTMAGRWGDTTSPGKNDTSPGPGDYDATNYGDDDDGLYDGSAGKRNLNRKTKRGVTFGARPATGGALSHLGESSSKPGPGQYHNPEVLARRDKGPSYSIRNRNDGKHGVGQRLEMSDAPGPGEYHDGEDRFDDFGRKGVTIGGRASAVKTHLGSDSPGPAFYVGTYTSSDLDRGPSISFDPGMASGRDAPGGPDDSLKSKLGIPGPGYYAPEVFQFPIKDAPEGNVGPGGEFLWAPKGYTFGWHGAYGEEKRNGTTRDDPSPGPGAYEPDTHDFGEAFGLYGASTNTETPWRPKPGVTIGVLEKKALTRRSQSAPGPGAYYKATDYTEGSAGGKGPKRGVTILDRKNLERLKKKETEKQGPAPTDYDVRTSGTRRLTETRFPAHTIARRYVESVRQKNETENAPAPGAYETAGSAFRRDGGVKWNDPPSRDQNLRASLAGPAPGEYEPDVTASVEKLKATRSKTGVNIERGTTRAAPGGVFDGSRARDPTPGPGEFELDGEAKLMVEALRWRYRGGVDIGRGTNRDAPGGVFDGIKNGTDASPGPGEFWRDGDSGEGLLSSGQKKGFQFPSTSHASFGGALDHLMRGGDTPGPGEHWPDDEGTSGGRGREGSRRVAGFTMPRSQRDVGKETRGSRGEDSPGPGEFDAEIDDRTGRTAVNMGRATGREAWGGVFDTKQTSPGPGEHAPEFEDEGGKSIRQKGVKWSDLRDGKNNLDGVDAFAPGPGEYEPVTLRTVGPSTMPKAKKRSSLVSRDAAQRPGPGEHEPDDDTPNPMTVAGLLRKRAQMGNKVEATPEQLKAAEMRRLRRQSTDPPLPGPASYDVKAGGIRNDKGVKMQSRKRWEKLGDMESTGGSGLPPGKYDPKPEAAAARLKPGNRVPRGNDFEDTFRSTKGKAPRGLDTW